MAIDLGVFYRSEMMFYFVTGKEISELLVNELGPIISYYGIWYPKVGEYIPLDELPDLHLHDGG